MDILPALFAPDERQLIELRERLKSYHLPEQESGSKLSAYSHMRAFDEAGALTGPFGSGSFRQGQLPASNVCQCPTSLNTSSSQMGIIDRFVALSTTLVVICS